jgi:hypothetical protein
MKNTRILIQAFLFFLPFFVFAQSKEVAFTMDDRDRLIRAEQKIESLRAETAARFEAVDKRFDLVDKRFDQLFNFLWAIIGIFTTMMVSVFGFAFWDRKLSLAPLKKEDQRIVSVLSDFAQTQPKLHEIMKNAGLM